MNMKGILYFAVVTSLVGVFSMWSPSFAEPPQQIGGIRLGANIKNHEDLFRMETSLRLRHMEYLSEVEVKPFEGFKAGYVTYGNCHEPGRIVKLKLKYEREDREFFDELLAQFKKKFGEPQEYKGDAFRTFLAWKWAFTDKDRNRISLILQHNSEDDEEYTSGNSLKMSMTTLIDKERLCHEKKSSGSKPSQGASSKGPTQKKTDFKLLLPE